MRYIDAEKIKYHKLSVCEGHGLNFEYTVAYKHEVDAIPSADVVPKSEVEELKKTLDNYEECSGLKKAKQEVVREIFEEIYEDCFDQFGYIDYEKLAQLKKKYTEGGAE